MGKLDNRVAIVTGASSGVGRGVAKVLAQNGAKVCACARRMELWFLRIRSLLKDEKKLRMKRLQEYDERNVQLNLKAHNTAGVILIFTGYVIMLVAGFFSMEVFWTVWALVMLYFALFITGRIIYGKVM